MTGTFEAHVAAASDPNRLQRSTLTTLFIITIVLAALSVPVALFGLFGAYMFSANIDEVVESTGMTGEAATVDAALFVGALIVPLPLLTTAAILLGRWRKRQRLSQAAVKAERALRMVGAAIASVFTSARLQRGMSAAAFILSLGALYNLLGIGSAVATPEQAAEELAWSFFMIIDPMIMAFALPGIILGVIVRKLDLAWSGLALAGNIISVICIVLSFTKVGLLLPIVVQSFVHAFSRL